MENTLDNDAITHDAASRRFTTTRDGQEAVLEYEREGDVLVITHTIVPPALGGRGIAGQLVETALRYARSEGLKVLPRCSYADAYMRKHAGYADLRLQS